MVKVAKRGANDCLMQQPLIPDEVIGTEQTQDTPGRLHPREGFAVGHLVPKHLPHAIRAITNNFCDFFLHLGRDDLICIQKENVVCIAMLD